MAVLGSPNSPSRAPSPGDAAEQPASAEVRTAHATQFHPEGPAAECAGQRVEEHKLASGARANAGVRLGLQRPEGAGALLEPHLAASSEAGEPWVACGQVGLDPGAPPARLRVLVSPAPGGQGCDVALGPGPPSRGSSGGRCDSGGWGTPAEPYSCAASDAGTLWGPRSPVQGSHASGAQQLEGLAGAHADALCQVWSPAADRGGWALLAKPGFSGRASEIPRSAGDKAGSPGRRPSGDTGSGRQRLSLLEALQAPPGLGPIEIDTALLYCGGDGSTACSAPSSLPASPREEPRLPRSPTSLRPGSLPASPRPGSALAESPPGSPTGMCPASLPGSPAAQACAAPGSPSGLAHALLPCSPAAGDCAVPGLLLLGSDRSGPSGYGAGQLHPRDAGGLANAPAAESPVVYDQWRSRGAWGLGPSGAEAGAPASGRGADPGPVPALARLRLDGDIYAHAELLDALAAALCEPCLEAPGLDRAGSAKPSAPALARDALSEGPASEILGASVAHAAGEVERRASGAEAGPGGQDLGIRGRIARLHDKGPRVARRPQSAQPWPQHPGAALRSSSCTPGGGAGGACRPEASSAPHPGAQDDSGEACRDGQPWLPYHGARLRSSSCMPAGGTDGACRASTSLHAEAEYRGSTSCGHSPAAGMPAHAHAAELQLHASPVCEQEAQVDLGSAATRSSAQVRPSTEAKKPPMEGPGSAEQGSLGFPWAPQKVRAASRGGGVREAGAAQQTPRSASAPRERPGRHVTRPQCAHLCFAMR